METVHINLNNKQKTDNVIAKQFVQVKAQAIPYNNAAQTLSLWQRFLQYAEAQQPNRFGWLAFSFFMQGCVLVPITLMIVVMRGNPFELWIPCLVGFVITETTNLAAMPTKVTIPVFWAGVVIDLLVVATCFLFY